MRIILAVVTGYIIFAGSAVVLFQAAGVDPHSPAPPVFTLLSIAYGIAFGLLSGYIAGRIGGHAGLHCGILAAALIALGAIVSLIVRPGAGALWTQISTVVLFAPACLLGDYFRLHARRHEAR
jgi:hypothetical protein